MARNPDFSLFNKIFETYDNLKFQKEPCVWPLIRIAPPLLMIFDPWKNRDLRVSRTTI